MPPTVPSTAPVPTTTTWVALRPARTYQVKQTEVRLPVGGSGEDALDVFVVVPIGGGPFPAVVFIHGYGSNAQAYSSVLDDFARHGFVVAGPNFTSNDVAQDTRAMRRTVDWLTMSPNELAPARVNGHSIGVMGHSLGGLTALAVAYNSCCRDPRIAATVTIEGPVGDLPNGTYEWSTPPLLIVLGDNDPLIPATTGPQLLSKFAGKAYLLTIRGGGHGGGMDATDPAHTAVLRTELDFLNAYLSHDPQSLHANNSRRERTTHGAARSRALTRPADQQRSPVVTRTDLRFRGLLARRVILEWHSRG